MTVAAAAPPPVHQPPTSVLLIDDHEVVAGALQIALDREQDFDVCGLATTIERGLANTTRLQPSLIITDLRLPDGDISDHLHRFSAAAPDAKVLIVTGWATERSFLACIGASTAGYVSKSRPLSEVVRGARRVVAGEVVFPTDYVPAILGRPASEHDAVVRPRLTARELDVLQMLARGHTTVEVSEGLFISINTVRNHLAERDEQAREDDAVGCGVRRCAARADLTAVHGLRLTVPEAAPTEPDQRLYSDADCLALVDERVADLAHKLAHDLHQPLFALGGFLELLATVPSLDADAREWMHTSALVP